MCPKIVGSGLSEIFQNFFKLSPISMKFFVWVSFMKRSAWLNFGAYRTYFGKKLCLKFVGRRFRAEKKSNSIQLLPLFLINSSQNPTHFHESIMTIWHTVHGNRSQLVRTKRVCVHTLLWCWLAGKYWEPRVIPEILLVWAWHWSTKSARQGQN